MLLLLIGLLLWSVVHLIPAAAVDVKQGWVCKLGENGYAASFSMIVICSLVLIVLGWRGTTPVPVYDSIELLRPLTGLLMLLAIFLFVASSHPTRVKRLIRHPQMTGVILWSAAHLLQSGDTRSILLFGWLAAWAILEIIFCNRRDGEWVKADSPNVAVEIRYLVIGLVVFTIFLFAHPLVSGVSVI